MKKTIHDSKDFVENVDLVVVHYDEIGIKGSNRSHFEDLLIENIRYKLKDYYVGHKKESGQFVFEVVANSVEKVADVISRIPGVSHFSFALKVPVDIDDFKTTALNIVEKIKSERSIISFRVDTIRHDKSYSLTSVEINKIVGEYIFSKTQIRGQMKNADLIVKIEISKKHAYISSKRYAGIGGLPTNHKQKVVSLLSGGFDSPVASFMMMKRGCEVILVHCQNQSIDTCSVENKILEISKQLAKYQIKTKLYIVPFGEIQKKIIMQVDPPQRMLMYRRMMLKIANEVAYTHRAHFVVVGDSFSQVASQTMDNLHAVYMSSRCHVFSPLIGMNKNEIVEISRKIGTFDISKQPYGDCCSFFVPKHPELHANFKVLDKYEDELAIDEFVRELVASVEVVEFE